MTEGLGSAWLDGRIVPLDQASVPVSDRGFLFADSVFETVRTYARRPFLLGDHLDRLRRSANKVLLPLPWTDEMLSDVVEQLLDRWPKGQEAVLRIMVTRGDGGHGLALPEPQVPRLVVLCRPLPTLNRDLYVRGVKVVLPSEVQSKDHAIPADVKSGSYLANVLALAEARARGGFEALLRGMDGSLSEASTSNLFVAKNSVLMTPGISDDILPGITRSLVLALAHALQLVVSEQSISDEQVFSADEVFLTSSIKEVLPVRAVGNRRISSTCPGPVTELLMNGFGSRARELSSSGVLRLSEVLPL